MEYYGYNKVRKIIKRGVNMLESFRVSNFASFKDEVYITTLCNSSRKELIKN